ncbi:MFS transporter [Aspergillus candidus]|uniref:Permease of the major facilitator superfamily n=1 Tax=Aspergillus candidus TaxID=41067 RepID=A0A2I2FMU6_ASPCN|nr:permease of the major facilitator superfamily [Aspergillus candidus]PLB41944.1 permease of the major facilitator superfamily [Aspergillus candidus]
MKPKPILPKKQLLILSICRFAEPVVLTSVLPYLPEMIEQVGVPRDQVAKWVGITSAATSLSQAAMAVPWGTASDHFGRKPIILLGLSCTMVVSVLFGLSRTLTALVISRAFLGLLNGNVGIIRTMVAEMVPQRDLQPVAFSVMPLVWTVGSIFGPAFGGALAKPVEKHPGVFGGDGWVGTVLGRYPFLLPNLLAAGLFVVGILTGFLFLEETLSTRKNHRDYGLLLGRALTRLCVFPSRRKATSLKREEDEEEEERTPLLGRGKDRDTPSPPRPRWREVFTPQSNLILVAYACMSMHTMAFDSLLPVFLHREVQPREGNPDVRLPWKFLGGFGVDAQTIGIYYTLIGTIGMFVQFLIFPPTAKRHGALACLRIASIIFPILYLITPFTALVPPSLRHATVFLLMLAKLAASIFGFPCTTILLTNSASSLRVLGTLNGVATSVSAVGRAVGPAATGAAFSYGVRCGYIICPWWLLAAIGGVSALPIFWVVEPEGFDEMDERIEYEQTDSESESDRD